LIKNYRAEIDYYFCSFSKKDKIMTNNNTINTQQSPETIRSLGGALIFLGVLLAGGMGALMIWINNAMTNPASTIKFNKTSPQNDLIFPILGVVAFFGVTAMVAGIWQVATGKRNKTLIWIMLGIGIILVIAANVIPAIF